MNLQENTQKNIRGNERKEHLNETELDSVLVGDATPTVTAHLAGCGPCKSALAEIEAPLASFRAVTLAWSERRSATLPLNDLAQARRRAAAGWRQRLALSAGLAAALAVGVAVPLLHHQGSTSAARNQPAVSTATVAGVETASAVPQESPEQQISRDNQMLRAIDQELDSNSDSPASLGLQPVKSQARSYTTHLQD